MIRVQIFRLAFLAAALGNSMSIADRSHAITYKLSIDACGGTDTPVEFFVAPAPRFESLSVMGLTVMVENDEQRSEGKVMWQISADPVVSEAGEISAGVDLRRIVYGVVPKGFSVIHEAVHLECSKNYVVTVSAAGHIGQLAFTPGEATCSVPDGSPPEN